MWQTRRKKLVFKKHDILLTIEGTEILDAAKLKTTSSSGQLPGARLSQGEASRRRADISYCVERRMNEVSATYYGLATPDTTRWLEPMIRDSRTTD